MPNVVMLSGKVAWRMHALIEAVRLLRFFVLQALRYKTLFSFFAQSMSI